MNPNGLQITDRDGDSFLVPFDKVLTMSRPKGERTLFIKLFDPMGVSIKIDQAEEVTRVWSAFKAWLEGYQNP